MNLANEIKQAKEEVAYTRLNMEFAVGEHVDETIHLHNAALAKYKRLLLQAKQEGVKANEIEFAGVAKRR